MKMVRQGDILLVKVDHVPEDAKQKDNILALGEGSGNAHLVQNAKVVVKEMDTYVIVDEDTKNAILAHNNLTTGQKADHDPITLEAGAYKVMNQRRYNTITRRVERIVD